MASNKEAIVVEILGGGMEDHVDVTNSKSSGKAAPNPDPDHVAVWIALNRSRVALMRYVDKTLRDAGLPPLTWYDVLWSIEKRGGVARPAEIIEDLLFEPSALSHMLKRIEARRAAADTHGGRRQARARVTHHARRQRRTHPYLANLWSCA